MVTVAQESKRSLKAGLNGLTIPGPLRAAAYIRVSSEE